jgi:hypothetical protein
MDYCNIKLLFDVKEVTQMGKASKESVGTRLNEAQNELGIEKEASYIISVINPKAPVPEGYPSSEEPPNYRVHFEGVWRK